MNDRPLVSVVTPSFNQAEFIEHTILSVLGQTYPRIEYIVVDGCSTDGTVAILEKFEGRLKYVSERDLGQSHAINKGWSMARGDMLAWLNSDDTYEPHAIETAVCLLRENPEAGMVCGVIRNIDERGRELGLERSVEPNIRDILFGRAGWNIAQPATLIRRSVIEEVGLLDEQLEYAMDHDLWTRIALRYPILYTDIVLANFRVWPNQKTSLSRTDDEFKARQRRDHLLVQERCLRQYLGAPRYYAWKTFRAGRRAGGRALRRLGLREPVEG